MEGWEDLVLQCRRYRGERSVLESWGGRRDNNLGCGKWLRDGNHGPSLFKTRGDP